MAWEILNQGAKTNPGLFGKWLSKWCNPFHIYQCYCNINIKSVIKLPHLKEKVQPKQCNTCNYWKHRCIFARHWFWLFSGFLYI